MIAHLRGELLSAGPGYAVVDAGGVGYRVWMGARQLQALQPGTTVSLHVATQVREDAIQLYGFPVMAERDAFERLLGVAGIGPKVALGLLGSMPLDELARAVEADDLRALTAAPGVGLKTARRVALELKGRLPALPVPEAGPAPGDPLPLALARLGYRKSEIDTALAGLAAHDLSEASLQDRLSACLRILSGANP